MAHYLCGPFSVLLQTNSYICSVVSLVPSADLFKYSKYEKTTFHPYHCGDDVPNIV